MKGRLGIMLSIGVGIACLWLAPALAKDPGAKPDAAAEAAQMEAWMKSMTPGPEHKAMEFFIGDWTTHSTMWMEGQESKSEGTMHAEWGLGGRYVIEKHAGEFNGMPFEGLGVSGYDNVNQEYFNVWFDNMGTGVMTSKGKGDAGAKSVPLIGSIKDPMTGKMMNHRMVSTITGPDTFKFEMWITPAGAAETKAMEANYTRVKKG